MIKKPDSKEVAIPKMKLDRIKVRISGEMLVMHKFSEKMRKQMEEGFTKTGDAGKTKRPPRVPHEEYLGAYYCFGKEIAEGRDVDPKERYGVPAINLKAAMVAACRNVDGFPMTKAKQVFFVVGEFCPVNKEQLVEIKTVIPPAMRTDVVRLESGVATLRYRPEFTNWWMDVVIEFDSGVVSASHLVNLLQIAGFGVGLCENRPEKSGNNWGRFQIVNEDSEEGTPETKKEAA